MTVTRGAVSARLAYSDLSPADVGALARLVSDWRVARQTGSWGWPANPEMVVARCRPPTGPGFLWGIRTAGRMVGTVGVSGDGTLGYMLAPDHWGQGFASEAAGTAIAHAFATREIGAVNAAVWEGNPASVRVLEKLGFSETGHETAWSRATRAGRVQRLFALRRADWRLPARAP